MTSSSPRCTSLAASPSNATARQVVISDAQTLANAINGAYSRVQSTQSQHRLRRHDADDADQPAFDADRLAQPADHADRGGFRRDRERPARPTHRRDRTLSGLVNVTATTQTDGSVTVALADAPSVVLVNEEHGGGAGTTQSLSASYNATSATPLTISASTSGALGTGIPSSGSLGSDLDVANNVIGAPAASGGTGLLGQMDGVANALRTQMNTQNAAGFDLNGNAGTANFFTGTGAADIAVSTAFSNNPSLIAAGNGTGSLDGSNAQAMAGLQTSSSIIPAFQTMVSNLGQTVSTAAENQTTQDAVTKQLQTQQRLGLRRLHRRGNDQPDQLPERLLRLGALHLHDFQHVRHLEQHRHQLRPIIPCV